MAETLLLLEETSSALQEAKTLRNQALKDLDREEMRIYRILFWPWTAVFLLVSLVWPIALLVLYPSYTIGSVFSAIGIQWSIAVVALFVVRGILSKTATRWIEPTMKALFKAETNLREARKASLSVLTRAFRPQAKPSSQHFFPKGFTGSLSAIATCILSLTPLPFIQCRSSIG